MISLPRLIRKTIEGSLLASRVITEVHANLQQCVIVEKTDGAGPQTRADTHSQFLIEHSILQSFPNLAPNLITEEDIGSIT
jgi:3'-phosphoadenosine 5'-phosphosulfate (PAPS) 3'-phosphatase